MARCSEVSGSGRRFLDDTGEIVDVTEQKPDASGRRTVTVRVRAGGGHRTASLP